VFVDKDPDAFIGWIEEFCNLNGDAVTIVELLPETSVHPFFSFFSPQIPRVFSPQIHHVVPVQPHLLFIFYEQNYFLIVLLFIFKIMTSSGYALRAGESQQQQKSSALVAFGTQLIISFTISIAGGIVIYYVRNGFRDRRFVESREISRRLRRQELAEIELNTYEKRVAIDAVTEIDTLKENFSNIGGLEEELEVVNTISHSLSYLLCHLLAYGRKSRIV